MIFLSGPSDQVQQQPALRHHSRHRLRRQGDRQQGPGPAAGTVCVCLISDELEQSELSCDRTPHEEGVVVFILNRSSSRRM